MGFRPGIGARMALALLLGGWCPWALAEEAGGPASGWQPASRYPLGAPSLLRARIRVSSRAAPCVPSAATSRYAAPANARIFFFTAGGKSTNTKWLL